jgi:gluconokinase
MQVVVMGVSGTGKTTVAQGMAQHLGWDFVEGDDLHPAANVAKMTAGHPLTDEDRWPWLRSIGERLSEEAAAGRSVVVTCSALRRAYRDLLREGRPDVVFCHLVASPKLLADRMQRRTGHFMPASLLTSQLAALDPLEPDEPGVTVAAVGEPEEVVSRALDALGLTAT